MKLVDAELVFLDIQTTGATPTNGNILEVAWCSGRASDPKLGKLESFLIKQPEDASIPPRITAITGITDEHLKDAVDVERLKEALEETLFRAEVPGATVIHFAQFERPFLSSALDETYDQLQIYCTHQIAARLFPNLPSRGIRGLSGYFGLPLHECKRAESHVQATFNIWQHLVKLLSEQGVHEVAELQTWLIDTPKAKRTKYEYPLEKQLRLSMPDQPGVYRMLSVNGDVLYVGKATSLKDRVNSYFRGKRKKDPRKLEMLTQTRDIRVTPCDTVVEACLIETDEIKRLSPPYNISLKESRHPLVFYDAAFESCAANVTAEHSIGPFRSEFVMDSFVRLNSSLRTGEMDPLMFFDEIPAELLDEGFTTFLEFHQIPREHLVGPRNLLAVGMKFLRLFANVSEPEDDEEVEPIIDNDAALDDGPQNTDIEPDEEIDELTPEDVAGKYERLLMRAARAYRQSKRLTKLLNTNIIFEEQRKLHLIKVRNGTIEFVRPDAIPQVCEADDQLVWSLRTFDRMRILKTELDRVKKVGGRVVIHEHTETPQRVDPRERPCIFLST